MSRTSQINGLRGIFAPGLSLAQFLEWLTPSREARLRSQVWKAWSRRGRGPARRVRR